MNMRLEHIYSQIPKSDCVPDCGECCGILFPSRAEISNIKEWCEIHHQEFLDFTMLVGEDCPYLGKDKDCTIYPMRPFLCRICGVSSDLPCPINKCTPTKVLNHNQSSSLYKAIYLHGKEKSQTEKHRRLIRELLSKQGKGTNLKLLLINAINSEAPDRLHPPLGLAYLAASLRKESGNEIECKITDSNITDNIKTFNPDIVGITSVSRNYNVAKGYAAIAKQAGLPVIIGGVHISVLPETMTDDMDVAVIGEGENAIIDLIDWYLNTGILMRSDLGIENPYLIKPLDNIPFPARDLLNIGKHASMITSRGCPYKCAFCSTSRYTRNQVRYHSAEYVADEMELIYRQYKPEYITIYDDLFAIDTKRVIEIQQLMAAKNLIGKFNLAVNTRANFITDELAEVLHDMNVKVVALGVESGCQKTLDYLKSGGITVEDNARAIRILKKHHIRPYCIFIIGSPDEDMESVSQTLQFIKDNKIEHFDINVLAPFPGTPVWDYALSRNLVSNDMDWSKLDYNITSKPIILSENISREDLMAVWAKVEVKRKRSKKKRSILNIIKHPYKYIIKAKLSRMIKC